MSILDRLANAERPVMSRSDYVRKLVYDAERKEKRK